MGQRADDDDRAALRGEPRLGFVAVPLAVSVAGFLLTVVSPGAPGRRAGLVLFAVAVAASAALLVYATSRAGRRAVAREEALRQALEERRRGEEERGELQARLSAAFQAMRDGIIVFDAQRRIVMHNGAAARMSGVSPEVPGGATLDDLLGRFQPFDLDGRPVPEHEQPVRRVLRGESISNLLLKLHRGSDGREAVVSFSGEPVRGPGGETTLAVVTFRDVSERFRAEERLRAESELARRSQSLLRAFSDSMPDPILIKDRDSRWTFANPAALAVVQRPLEEALGRTDAELYTDASLAAAVMDNDRRVMESGEPTVFEETVATPTGTRTFLSMKIPYRDAEGAVIGLLGSARDITHRKRIEEELVLRERRFRALLERSGDMIAVVDPVGPGGQGGKVTFWSANVAEQLGLGDSEVVGRPLVDRVDQADLETAERLLAAVCDEPARVHQGVLRLRHKRGASRQFAYAARNLADDPALGGVVMNLRDITEQVRLEEQFQQAQKLESLGRLAGGVAHDFNNLLTVILSCSDMVRADMDAGAPASLEDLELIRGAGERGRGLTRQLLAFARKQVVQAEPLDLGEVLRGAEKMLGRILGEDVELTVRAEPGLWQVLFDSSQLEQVILNLAVNARDAMPRGGKLRIDVANHVSGPEDGEPAEAAPGSAWVRLRVADTGSGMAQEVLAHVFEPFFTTKDPGQGTGLGLATVYGIVKQAGGHVRVESSPGQGARFELCFPRHQPSAAPPAARPRALDVHRGGGETILLAEDDVAVRRLVVRVLKGAGYRVLEATSGEDAVELAAREARSLHLVITDVVMPGLDGRQVADAVSRLRAGVPVLFVSGYSHDILGNHGVLEPGIELLPKPFTTAALLERVRQLLDHR